MTPWFGLWVLGKGFIICTVLELDLVLGKGQSLKLQLALHCWGVSEGKCRPQKDFSCDHFFIWTIALGAWWRISAQTLGLGMEERQNLELQLAWACKRFGKGWNERQKKNTFLLNLLSQPWLSVLIYRAALALWLRVTVRTLTGPVAAADIGLLMHCQRKGEAAKNFLSSQPLYLGPFGKCSAHTHGLGLGSAEYESLELHMVWSCQVAPSERGTSFIRVLPLETSSSVWLVLHGDSSAKASVQC